MDFPGEKLVLKLWETLAEKPLCGLLRPYQMKREAEANLTIKRKEIIMLAQAEKEADRIRNGECLNDQVNHKLLIPSIEGDKVEPVIDLNELYIGVRDEIIADKIRLDSNVAKAILIAEDILSKDNSEPPQEKINDDWLYRWRDKSSQVTSVELQELWGSVLAGEVKQPGSFSLRTIDFLSGLTQYEAILIEKMKSLVFDNKYIFRESTTASVDLQPWLTIDEVLELLELGVISEIRIPGLGITHEVPAGKGKVMFYNSEKIIFVQGGASDIGITVGIIPLTKLGRELLAFGTIAPNFEMFLLLARYIKSKVGNAKIFDILSSDGKKFEVINGIDV